MSCQHGNWPPCDECDALDEAYERGYKDGKASAEAIAAAPEPADDPASVGDLLFRINAYALVGSLSDADFRKHAEPILEDVRGYLSGIGYEVMPEVVTAAPEPVRVGEAEAFEAWARPRFPGAEVFDRIEGRPGGWEYNGNAVQSAWAVWRARAALAGKDGA